MRRILLVKSRRTGCAGIKSIVSYLFLDAAFDEVDCVHASAYLKSGAAPDLIIYAPRTIGRPGRNFRSIKSLSGKAKILVYSRIQEAEQYLFDYLAAGVNGILATNAQLVEQFSALDTVMRGDSFVDGMTRRKMLTALAAKQQAEA